MKKIKLSLVGILFLIIFSSLIVIQNVQAYLGIDDAIVAGVGCIVGGFAAGGSCVPYKPPSSGYDCGVCNDRNEFPFGKCTEYTCRAIGKDCRFVPSLDNSEEGFCENVGSLTRRTTPPKIVSCGVIDMSTLAPKSDVKSLDNSCDLGELNLDGEYALILSTDRFGECRFSTIPNHRDLFMNLYGDIGLSISEGGEPPSVDYSKVVENAQINKINLFTEMPNGVDHVWPIFFNEGWTLENIAACNSGGCTWYARCADFDGSNPMEEDYAFSFKIGDAVGDVEYPRIITFSPVDQPGSDRYGLALNQQGNLDMSFAVFDISGVESCRYSNQNVGFNQMSPVSCRAPNEEESRHNPGDQNNLRTCEASLSNIKEGENKFYFNCRDTSENQNIAPRPYVYTVVGASQLALEIKNPADGATIDGVGDELHVQTSGGINGLATCTYSHSKIIGGGVSGVNLLFASDTAGSEDKRNHRQGLEFLPENGEYNLNVECKAIGDDGNKASGSLNINLEKAGITITKESPADLTSDKNPALRVKTGGYDGGKAACRYYDSASFVVFDERSGKKMTTSGNVVHEIRLQNLNLGKHTYSIVCQSLDKRIQGSAQISFEVKDKLPVACTSNSQCPSCSGDKYCATVVGSGKHLCDPGKVKESCVSGFCSAISCPSGDKFSTDYCDRNKNDLCLSDKDNDGVADNLDCNDNLASIGQCSLDSCQKCNEDESRDDNGGICVAISNCTPKTPVQPGPVIPTGEKCSITSISWRNINGGIINNIKEGEIVNVLLEGRNCRIGDSVDYKIKEKDVFVTDWAQLDDVIEENTLILQSVEGAIFEWTATRQEDGYDPDNEYYIEIGDKKSSGLKVSVVSPIGPGDGGGSSGEIMITVTNPVPFLGKRFELTPIEFDLDISTGKDELSIGECKYTFKNGRYSQRGLDFGEVPEFNGMYNFDKLGRLKQQTARVKLYEFTGSEPFRQERSTVSIYNGDYGYYIRCERDGRYGEKIGYVTAAIGGAAGTSGDVTHGECNLNGQCVQISGAGSNQCVTDNDCASVSIQPSSLRVVNKGPSGTQADTMVNLTVTLSGGPSNYGQDAECRFTNTPSNILLEKNKYNAIIFPETLNFDPTNVVLGSTVYRKEVNLDRTGDYTYYVKCKDTLGRLTDLQTISFKVEIPASQQISIVRKSPEGEYGSKNVALAIETNGGLDNGASVNCNYQGIIGGGSLTKQQITGGRYMHNTTVQNVPDGDYVVTINCVDRANQVASAILNINVQEDLIAPVEQLIITKGSSKFVTVSEGAECEASTDNANWQKVGSDSTKRKHVITLSGTYYFRCKDLWGNQMQTIKINP